MRLSSPLRPRIGNRLAFTDRHEYIPDIHFGKCQVYLSTEPFSYSLHTAYITEDFFYDQERDPEAAFQHWFGRHCR